MGHIIEDDRGAARAIDPRRAAIGAEGGGIAAAEGRRGVPSKPKPLVITADRCAVFRAWIGLGDLEGARKLGASFQGWGCGSSPCAQTTESRIAREPAERGRNESTMFESLPQPCLEATIWYGYAEVNG